MIKVIFFRVTKATIIVISPEISTFISMRTLRIEIDLNLVEIPPLVVYLQF